MTNKTETTNEADSSGSELNDGLGTRYGKNAPYCTLPAKRQLAKSNTGKPLFEWATKIMVFDGKVFKPYY